MLLNIVTDDELLTSQIVKTILLVIVGGGIVFNLVRLFRSVAFKSKVINLIIFIFLAVIFVYVFKVYRIEAALLKSPVYVPGTTLGYCSVFAEGKGIQFEYVLDGKRFLRCNTFHPIPKDSIKVPGGKYLVRVSKKFPDQGRMDFQKSAE